jgi:putative proteasome-type protease
MTYCVAITLNSGIVFASDSRTNAGVDYVTTFSKMHVYQLAKDRLFVILTAGNLATSQEVLNRVQVDLDDAEAKVSLRTVKYLFDAANYIGELSQQAQADHYDALKKSSVSGEATFIIGGQIGSQPHGIFMVYPQGNYIAASPATPYHQIGETKYGKPILDRVIGPTTSLEDAARCALVSIDSTMRSNMTVGPPVELAIYAKDEFQLTHRMTLKPGADYYSTLQKRWNQGLRKAFNSLPRFDWEKTEPGKT